jgi:hypothetical protein
MNPACNPAWGVISSAFLTPLIAIIVAYIAFRQWRTAQNRLKLDLFDRRFAVYEAAQKLALEVSETSNVSREGLSAFIRGTEKSVFLFYDKALIGYLTAMRERAVNLHTVTRKLAGDMLPTGSEPSKLPQERADLSTWFAGQFDVLIETFKPHLLTPDKWL